MNIPILLDEKIELPPQFAPLNALRKKKRELMASASESEKKYRQLDQQERDGNRTSNDQAENVRRVLAGEELPIDADISAQKRREGAKFSALTEAIRVLDIQIRAETNNAALKICEDLKPHADKIMVRLTKALAEAHSANVELFALERALVNNGIGLRGICNNRPAFLGIPSDKSGELALFFRQAVADKHITALPKEFK